MNKNQLRRRKYLLKLIKSKENIEKSSTFHITSNPISVTKIDGKLIFDTETHGITTGYTSAGEYHRFKQIKEVLIDDIDESIYSVREEIAKEK